jgi:hypothetical protein
VCVRARRLDVLQLVVMEAKASSLAFAWLENIAYCKLAGFTLKVWVGHTILLAFLPTYFLSLHPLNLEQLFRIYAIPLTMYTLAQQSRPGPLTGDLAYEIRKLPKNPAAQ